MSDGERAASSLASAYRKNLFQRELKLHVIAGAAGKQADQRVGKVPSQSRRGQHRIQNPIRKATSKAAASAAPVKDLFDADATLRMLVDFSRYRSSELHQHEHPTGLSAHAAAAEEGSATATIAALSIARHALSSKLDPYGIDDEADPDTIDLERQPATEAELEQEIAWLNRKLEASRQEAQEEEAAVRGRAKERGRTLTAHDIAFDDRVLAARKRHSRFSRRKVALLRLRKPGAKFGPRAAVDVEQEDGDPSQKQPQDAMLTTAARHDPAQQVSPAEGSPAFKSQTGHALGMISHDAPKGSPDHARRRAGGLHARKSAADGSMYARAVERYHAERMVREAAKCGERAREGSSSSGSAPGIWVSSGTLASGVHGGLSPDGSTGQSGATALSPAARRARRRAAMGIATRVPSLSADLLMDGTLATDKLAIDTSAAVLPSQQTSWEAFTSRDARWSLQLRNVRKMIELRTVRDAVRLLRDLRERAAMRARQLPPPRPPLGVSAGARTLALMQHAFRIERADRCARQSVDLERLVASA